MTLSPEAIADLLACAEERARARVPKLPNGALMRDIVRALAASRQPLGSKDIAARVGRTCAGISVPLSRLLARGQITQAERRGPYSLEETMR